MLRAPSPPAPPRAVAAERAAGERAARVPPVGGHAARGGAGAGAGEPGDARWRTDWREGRVLRWRAAGGAGGACAIEGATRMGAGGWGPLGTVSACGRGAGPLVAKPFRTFPRSARHAASAAPHLSTTLLSSPQLPTPTAPNLPRRCSRRSCTHAGGDRRSRCSCTPGTAPPLPPLDPPCCQRLCPPRPQVSSQSLATR